MLWLGLRAEADAATGDFAALIDRARAIVAAGERGRFIPAVTTAYGLLCEAETQRGDPDPWQRAADAWETLGHPFPAAYARWRQAEALLARRRARDGAEVLVAAHAAAERLGAAPLAPRTRTAGGPRARLARAAGAGRARRARGGARAHPPRARGARPGRRGLTNREIAQALFVTEKTAGAHVSSILAKLRVRSRVEAATTAQRLGLV